MNGLPPGSLLQKGKYTIVQILGEGGYGIAYLAQAQLSISGKLGSIKTSTQVCVKEFFPGQLCLRQGLSVMCNGDMSHYSTFQTKFRKEAQSLAGMSHPNIVRVIDVFDENGTTYYVMEHISGGSLFDLVKKRGPLDEKTAISYIRQIGDALHYLHKEKNFLHLDVKPANILINEQGQAVLIDFGIAKHYHPDSHEETTDTPIGVSPGFAPIEQYDGHISHLSPETDVYSLTATLYYLLTGKNPPTATMLSQHPESFIQPVEISPFVWSVIKKGMAVKEEMRYHSAREFVRALENVASDDTITINATEIQVKKNRKGAKRLIIGAAIVCAIGIGIFAALLLPSPDSQTTQVQTPPDSVNQYEPQDTLVIPSSFTDEYGNKFTYEGQLKDGKPHGHGIAYSVNGWIYEGPFQNGLRKGKDAKLTYNNGNIFVGEVINKQKQSGKVTTPEGTYFKGDLNDWKPYNGTWYTKDKKPFVKVKRGKEEYLE